MSLEELKKAYDALSPKEQEELSGWIADREMEAELNRRIAEAEADPSILLDGEKVMAEMKRKQKERREKLQLSPSGSD